jgi:hypothetical protein
MDGLVSLSVMLLIRGLSMELAGSGGPSPTNQVATGAAAMIALTALDVNDQTLTLRYKIINRSDHDIWVCEAVGIVNKPSAGDHELYVDSDALSLVIAKRIEGPMQVMYVRPPNIEGRYIRVSPAQERTEFLSLAIPAERHTLFTSRGPDIISATRLLLRIGYYEKDLTSGQDGQEATLPYGWGFQSGDERSLGISIDGVLIPVGK